MKKILIIVQCLMISTCFGREATGKSYQFSVPEAASFEVHERLEFYTFRWGKAPHITLFMLNANPAPGSDRTIKPMADMMEVSLEDGLKQRGQASEITKKRTEVALGPFKGIQLQFTIKHQASGLTLTQYALVLHDGERIWNAQLTAHDADDIETAHAILKSAKKVSQAGTGLRSPKPKE